MTSADENVTSQATQDRLAERERVGNWCDIVPTDKNSGRCRSAVPYHPPYVPTRIGPEVGKRLAEKAAPKEARLNGEVRGGPLLRQPYFYAGIAVSAAVAATPH